MSGYEIGAMYEIGAGDDVSGDEMGLDILGDGIEGDEMGLDLIGDEMGAARRRARLHAAARGQGAGQAQVLAVLNRLEGRLNKLERGTGSYKLPGGVQVRETGPSKQRNFPLSFNSAGTVAAGTTVIIAVLPQVKIFRGQRYAVADSIAPFFLVNSVTIGTVNQFASAGAMAGETISSRAFGVAMEFDPCELGKQISISVTNTDSAAHPFLSTLFGLALE